MTILSQRMFKALCADSRRAFGYAPAIISGAGEILEGRRYAAPSAAGLHLARARAYGLQEALHWGEAYVFFPAPGLASWVAPMVDGQKMRGGLLGADVRIESEPASNAIAHWVEKGLSSNAASGYVNALPVWPKPMLREAAMALETAFYQISGWKPALLQMNKLKARQQQQIAESIEEQRKNPHAINPVDKERVLLSLIRSGERNDARRLLNEMLGVMFLSSPRLVVLRARTIELMGYLTRAAVEDSPLLEPLIERNHGWMEKLIRARDFETLSQVLMQALDDFMDGIYLHGFNCHDPRISRILDFIQQNYNQPVSLEMVAKHVGLSRFRISHIIKRSTGRTFLQHMMLLRIQKARRFLEHTEMSCAEIAGETGFCDQSYFVKHFRRITGITPARFRRAGLHRKN